RPLSGRGQGLRGVWRRSKCPCSCHLSLCFLQQFHASLDPVAGTLRVHGAEAFMVVVRMSQCDGSHPFNSFKSSEGVVNRNDCSLAL
ncbi:MAG: hypothetical protein Q8L52_00190, partial [bacterium]|nr:hypothetical protein [bacterium]